MAFTAESAALAGQEADEAEAESGVEEPLHILGRKPKSMETLTAYFTPLGGRRVEMPCLNCILITSKCFR